MASTKAFCIGQCEGVKDALLPLGCEIINAKEEDIISLIKEEKSPAVVFDLLDTIKGAALMKEIRNANGSAWIVAISINRDVKFIIDILKTGANDYLIKPINGNELKESVVKRRFYSVAEIGRRSTGDIDVEESYRKIAPSRFYNSFFIDEYGKIETLRAERYNRVFTIILSQVEWEKKVKDKEKTDILRKIINVIAEAARDSDVVGMAVNDQFMTILPETDYLGSLITIRKMRRAIENITKEYPIVDVEFSSASYPMDGRRYSELICTAENRIAEQKEGLFARFGMREKLFWEAVTMLLESKYDDPAVASTFDAGNDAEISSFFITRLQNIILKIIERHPKKRGILYLGLRKISSDAAALRALNNMPQTMTKVYIVGEGDISGLDIQNATSIYISDERLMDTYFILFMRDDTAYALFCREGWGGIFSCFHTVDPYLIEGLIEKFQKDYSLQEQL